MLRVLLSPFGTDPSWHYNITRAIGSDVNTEEFNLTVSDFAEEGKDASGLFAADTACKKCWKMCSIDRLAEHQQSQTE